MKKFFLVTIVISFVNMVVVRKGKGDMCGSKWTCIVIDRRIGGMLRSYFIYTPIVSASSYCWLT